MHWWFALSLAAQPALPASNEAARLPVRTQARASVRIVRPYRLYVGKARAVPGATRRETHVRTPGGQRQKAILIEFE